MRALRSSAALRLDLLADLSGLLGERSRILHVLLPGRAAIERLDGAQLVHRESLRVKRRGIVDHSIIVCGVGVDHRRHQRIEIALDLGAVLGQRTLETEQIPGSSALY